MQLFCKKKVNGFYQLTFSKRSLIMDTHLGSKYASDVNCKPFISLMYFYSFSFIKHAIKESILTIRMNEIFSCLACYGQKLNFFGSEIEKKKNTSSVKGSGKDEIGTIF